MALLGKRKSNDPLAALERELGDHTGPSQCNRPRMREIEAKSDYGRVRRSGQRSRCR